MTTIAYRDGVMAADTMGAWSGDVNYGVPKLAKTERFFLGFSGAYALAHPMYNWIKSKGNLPLREFYREPPEFVSDQLEITVLVASVEGTTLWYFSSDGHGAPLWNRKYESIGSGSRFALGAMYAGADPVNAVRAAIALDDGTGGDVVTIDREDNPCDIFSLDMTPIIA